MRISIWLELWSSRLSVTKKDNYANINRDGLQYSGGADASLFSAGEVGDGPDQGHSGGADSVPPAPNFCTLQHRANFDTCRILEQKRTENPVKMLGEVLC
jgi:hypothetical protein